MDKKITVEEYKALYKKYGVYIDYESIKDGTYEQVESMFRSHVENNSAWIPQ